MIFFESLFILIARFYTKTWKNYNSWWVGVRYGITVLYILNIGTINILLKHKFNVIVFMLLILSGYLFITYYKPKLNDKEYVKEFQLPKIWKNISLFYIIASVLIFALALVFYDA